MSGAGSSSAAAGSRCSSRNSLAAAQPLGDSSTCRCGSRSFSKLACEPRASTFGWRNSQLRLVRCSIASCSASSPVPPSTERCPTWRQPGSSNRSANGYPHPEVLEDFQTADNLCRRYMHRPEVMPAAVGVFTYFFARAEYGTARTVLHGVAELIDVPEGAWFAPEVKACLGYEAFHTGDIRQAWRLLEDAWEGFLSRPPEEMVSPFWGMPHDPVVITAAALACLAGLQGRMADSETWQR